MSRRAIALAVSTLAALAIVWAYAIDAALPDRHAYKTVTLPSTAPVRPWTIVSVDSAELGYPGRSSSAPATLPPRLPPVVRAESDAHVTFKLAEPLDLRSDDRSTAWIWLLAAALLTALAAIAAAFLRRRARTTTAAS